MNEVTMMNNMLFRIEQLVKANAKLQRKLGRKAWHLNRARAEMEGRVADLKQDLAAREHELKELRAAQDGLVEMVRQLRVDKSALAAEVDDVARHGGECLRRVTEERDGLETKLATHKATIAELETRLREGNPDYAEADVDRKAARAIIAHAHNLLDDMGVKHCDANGNDIPFIIRMEDLKQRMAKAGYEDLDGPDVKEPTHGRDIHAEAAERLQAIREEVRE